MATKDKIRSETKEEQDFAAGCIDSCISSPDGRLFYLKRPINVHGEHQDGYWQHECMDLGIFSCGPTIEASLCDFAEDFACYWDGLACEPDDNLTRDAVELKKKLISLVDRVV